MAEALDSRRQSRLVPALVLVGASLCYYVLGVVLAVQGSPVGWWFFGCGLLGAMAIQLATGPDGPFPSVRLQVGAARAWAVALVPPPLLSGAGNAWAILLVVALLGVWWPTYVARNGAGRLRPGYIIGGGVWTAAMVLAEAGVSYHLWTPHGQVMYRYPSAPSMWWLVAAALTPAYLALPVRILLAGLQRQAQEAGPRRPRRAILALMALTGSWGYVTVVRLLLMQKAALVPERSAAIAGTAVVWGLTMLWVVRLWRAEGRAAREG